MIQAAKILGTGLATTGLIGAGVGIGVVFGALILGVAINPSLRAQPFSYVTLGFAFSEAIWLFALVMAYLLSFLLLLVFGLEFYYFVVHVIHPLLQFELVNTVCLAVGSNPEGNGVDTIWNAVNKDQETKHLWNLIRIRHNLPGDITQVIHDEFRHYWTTDWNIRHRIWPHNK